MGRLGENGMGAHAALRDTNIIHRRDAADAVVLWETYESEETFEKIVRGRSDGTQKAIVKLKGLDYSWFDTSSWSGLVEHDII